MRGVVLPTRWIGGVAGRRAAVRAGGLLCAATVMAGAVAARPAHAAPPLFVNFHDAIAAAMQRGDAARLKALAGSYSGAQRDFAWAAYYRSVYQIARSSAFARRCDRAASVAADYAMRLGCGDLLAGNDAIQGNIAGWARTMQRTRDAVYPHLAPRDPRRTLIFPGFATAPDLAARIDMRDYFGFPPATLAGSIADDVLVPKVLGINRGLQRGSIPGAPGGYTSRTGQLYHIRITVNDRAVLASVDTGSEFDVVSAAEAPVLGLRVEQKGPAPMTLSTDVLRPVPARLGYANTLVLETRRGPAIVLHDTPVLVGGRRIGKGQFIIGRTTLARLGSLLIGPRGIVVHPTGAATACHRRLRLASFLQSDFSMFMRYPVNGRLADVYIDTGNANYLAATASAHLRVMPRSRNTQRVVTAGGGSELGLHLARVRFGPGPGARVFTIPVYANYHIRFPYDVGSDMLRYDSLFLDFRHGRACLVPHARP